MTRSHTPKNVPIDARLVERLIAAQFPQWAQLSIAPVEVDGHDNRTFRLGNELSVRVPSAQAYAPHVSTEHMWLPRLAPHLPLPIPAPIAVGQPSPELRWHWSICKWLEGENATIDGIDDLPRFAEDLADFLNALRAADTTRAPEPGPDNFFRGGDLSVYDGETRECLEELSDVVDARRATAVWESALASAWQGPPVWVHGDVAVDNLLVSQGRLCAVIDFGQLAAGDPACDVTIAWTLFAGESREAFRRALIVDEDTWARGRGWGLWKALFLLRQQRGVSPVEAAASQRVIDDILAESRGA